MAFAAPILIPDTEESKWSAQISGIFTKQLDTTHKIPSVSIFLVPEIIKKQKPEAYEPQQLGLGPNYHFKPWGYKKMEQKKLTAARRVLHNRNVELKDFDKKVHKLVKARVRDIRGCYDMFLQDDDHFLAWIFTLDGLFLLFHFHSYNSPEDDREETYELQQKNKDSNEHIITVDVDRRRRRVLAQDLMMVENQIPFTVLKEIDMAINPQSGNSIPSADIFSDRIYRRFCKTHSPLDLYPKQSQDLSDVEHLLDYMYHSVVKNNTNLHTDVPQDLKTSGHDPRYRAPTSQSKAEKQSPSFSFKNIPGPIFRFLDKIPWESFLPLYNQTVGALEAFSKNKTDIYSASELKRAGFQFQLLPKEEGICKLDSKGMKIHLPRLTLHTDSEVILRNLVVYETQIVDSYNFPLTEYVGLMCGLITNVNDVKLLKNEKMIIIEGDLREEEVAKIFNGLRSSLQAVKTNKESELQKCIMEVNTAYESQWSMSYVYLRKVARWLLEVFRALTMFAGASLNIVAFLISLMTVFLLTSQAYCEVYGCAKTESPFLTYTRFSQTT